MNKKVYRNYVPKKYILQKYEKDSRNNKAIKIIIMFIAIYFFPKMMIELEAINKKNDSDITIKKDTLLQSYDINKILLVCNENIGGEFSLEQNTLIINSHNEFERICNNSEISIEEIEHSSNDSYKVKVSFE